MKLSNPVKALKLQIIDEDYYFLTGNWKKVIEVQMEICQLLDLSQEASYLRILNNCNTDEEKDYVDEQFNRNRNKETIKKQAKILGIVIFTKYKLKGED